MAGFQIIADVSTFLLQQMRGAICPALLSRPEQISLSAPDKKDNESLLGVYLYSIRDYSSFVPEGRASLVGNSGYGASKAISLAYLVYFNHHAQTPLDIVTEHQVFGRVIQLLHTAPTIQIAEIHDQADAGDEPASISFQKLDDHQKQDMWSGFSEPMRPALYFEVGPLLIRGDRIAMSRVRTAEGGVERR